MTQVRRQRRVAELVLALVVLALAMPALAMPAAALAKLSPGVHVDPGSPAAKEYSIPLGAARGNGQSGSSGKGSLFGQGITKGGGGSGGSQPAATTAAAGPTSTPSTSPVTPAKPTATGKPATHRTGRNRAGARRAHGRSAATPAPRAVAVAPHAVSKPAFSPQRAIGTASSSGVGITWMLGAAVLVLLLGALGGTMLSRRDRRTDRSTSPHPG